MECGGALLRLNGRDFLPVAPYCLTEDGKPNTMFYNGVGIGVAVVMTIAITFFLKYKPRWSQQFGPQN